MGYIKSPFVEHSSTHKTVHVTNTLVVAEHRERIRKGDGMDIKRCHEDFLYGSGTVLHLDFSGDYTNLYMQKLHRTKHSHTYTHAHVQIGYINNGEN